MKGKEGRRRKSRRNFRSSSSSSSSLSPFSTPPPSTTLSPNSLVSLLPERAPLGQPRPTASRGAQHSRARRADDDRLRVAEHDGDLEAALALDVHEERVGGLDQPLELVLAGLEGRWRVEEVDVVGENLGEREEEEVFREEKEREGKRERDERERRGKKFDRRRPGAREKE